MYTAIRQFSKMNNFQELLIFSLKYISFSLPTGFQVRQNHKEKYFLISVPNILLRSGDYI